MDKQENKYVFDDSIDIGKEPLPIESEELEKTMKKCIERIKSSVKVPWNIERVK